MAKPDDRSDNAEKLTEMKHNAEENIRETKAYLNEFGDEISAEEKADLEAKNARREESIQGFTEEIADETSQSTAE
ncbi:small acid-soluble spore protein Tlp [Brevibacillus fluminis]|uniref:Small acid-soluble spore protein Tlp n=1 Tax=Brevibacillus fluminis TaxID=511487 RepID=A0A3M8CSH9_9BACL|nr:small acid-soluble spore protein Tlp [Brevibacillus fluminis]RNB78756.1 small acid-soluble spore protein Tlp [Brevibacillus fluminis]